MGGYTPPSTKDIGSDRGSQHPEVSQQNVQSTKSVSLHSSGHPSKSSDALVNPINTSSTSVADTESEPVRPPGRQRRAPEIAAHPQLFSDSGSEPIRPGRPQPRRLESEAITKVASESGSEPIIPGFRHFGPFRPVALPHTTSDDDERFPSNFDASYCKIASESETDEGEHKDEEVEQGQHAEEAAERKDEEVKHRYNDEENDIEAQGLQLNGIIIPDHDMFGEGPVRRSHVRKGLSANPSSQMRILIPQAEGRDFQKKPLTVTNSAPAGQFAIDALRERIPSFLLARLPVLAEVQFSKHSRPLKVAGLRVARLRLLLGVYGEHNLQKIGKDVYAYMHPNANDLIGPSLSMQVDELHKKGGHNIVDVTWEADIELGKVLLEPPFKQASSKAELQALVKYYFLLATEAEIEGFKEGFVPVNPTLIKKITEFCERYRSASSSRAGSFDIEYLDESASPPPRSSMVDHRRQLGFTDQPDSAILVPTISHAIETSRNDAERSRAATSSPQPSISGSSASQRRLTAAFLETLSEQHAPPFFASSERNLFTADITRPRIRTTSAARYSRDNRSLKKIWSLKKRNPISKRRSSLKETMSESLIDLQREHRTMTGRIEKKSKAVADEVQLLRKMRRDEARLRSEIEERQCNQAAVEHGADDEQGQDRERKEENDVQEGK